MIVKTGSAPVLSLPIKGAMLGSISSGKNVRIFEKQSVKNRMMTQIWYRVKINGSYSWDEQRCHDGWHRWRECQPQLVAGRDNRRISFWDLLPVVWR